MRDPVVAEFDQQVAGVSDYITLGVSQRILDVFVGKMEVASETELRSLASLSSCNRFEHTLQAFTIVLVAIICVRGGHHMRDAIRGSRLAHRDADVP